MVDFQPGMAGTYGYRPAVCLHDSVAIPYPTVLVAPLTGLYNKYGERKSRVDLTDIVLYKEHYPDGTIQRDSIVLVHQIQIVKHSDLHRYTGRLHDRDIQQIAYSLVVLFRLDKLMNLTAKNWSEMVGG